MNRKACLVRDKVRSQEPRLLLDKRLMLCDKAVECEFFGGKCLSGKNLIKTLKYLCLNGVESKCENIQKKLTKKKVKLLFKL